MPSSEEHQHADLRQDRYAAAIPHSLAAVLALTSRFLADRTHLIEVDASFTVADVKAAISARQGACSH